LHVIRVDLERLGDDLGKRGLVALARRHETDGRIDRTVLDHTPGTNQQLWLKALSS
jgi:hypothetical protein